MQTWNPLSWASEHWTQLTIGGVLATGIFRLHRAVTKVKKYLAGLASTQESVELIKTNHLPHLQVELEKINNNLSGMRDDARGFRDDLRALLMTRGS